nr:hypothetical protein [Tanacetum cinerariifolium]
RLAAYPDQGWLPGARPGRVGGRSAGAGSAGGAYHRAARYFPQGQRNGYRACALAKRAAHSLHLPVG